jgi:hypothetical protein
MSQQDGDDIREKEKEVDELKATLKRLKEEAKEAKEQLLAEAKEREERLLRLAATNERIERLREKKKRLLAEAKERDAEFVRLQEQVAAHRLKTEKVLDLKPFDVTKLVASPLDVAPIAVHEEEPEFCAEDGWLDTCIADMIKRLNAVENLPERIPPMGFMRCSRGGKTRALRELNKRLWEQHADIAVIYVTFSNFSSWLPWKNQDAVGALLRRIAFTCSINRSAMPEHHSYAAFEELDVHVDHITNWLGDTPCILLIDELNVLDMDKAQSEKMASFLKTHFLVSKNRYFAFSSHVAPTGKGLANFFDSISERKCLSKQLPLIPADGLADARRKLKHPSLTVTQALFRGRIPALVSYTKGLIPPSFLKRAAAISEVADEWNDERVRLFLTSFLNGNTSHQQIFPELLQLMSVTDASTMAWIPYHMVHVLESIAISSAVQQSLRRTVSLIRTLLEEFETGKTSGGDTWEALFVVVLMIRAVCGSFDSELLPLKADTFSNCPVFYNNYWAPPDNSPQFPDIKTFEQLAAGMLAPKIFPAIVVYYPPHAQFQLYDCFVVAWESAEKKEIYSYQLKEGAQIPDTTGRERSYWIRGDLVSQVRNPKGWIIATASQVDTFLGVSGALLAPKEWRRME